MRARTRARLRSCTVLGLLSLACLPKLSDAPARPGPAWPDLADPPSGRADARADAALIIALEDPAFGGRPGAWAVASGWVRYLAHTRGVPGTRIELLRDGEATQRRVMRALKRLEARAAPGGNLWFIFIGSGSTPDSVLGGQLRLAEGELEQMQLLSALGFGYHPAAFVLLDACADPATLEPGVRAGLGAAEIMTPADLVRPALLPEELDLGLDTSPLDIGGGPFAGLLSGGLGPRSDRTNLLMLSAGRGTTCRASLDGEPWPALAWAGLGALQGWGDANADGWVGGRELGVFAQALLAADGSEEPVMLELGGVDIDLATLHGRGPAPPAIARRRRDDAALEAGEATRAQAQLESAQLQLDLRLEDMVSVARGRFTMGCDDDDRDCEGDEKPAHEVELSSYAIDRHEVTWAQYARCIEQGRCARVPLATCEVWTGESFVRGAGVPEEMFAPDHPVFCVDWNDAARYCEAMGKHLPTEAQWERAARGLDGRRFPWGERAPSCTQATIDGCSETFTQAVGQSPEGRSPVGAEDMAGNVAEWIYDWWDPDTYGARTPPDPAGPALGEARVVRGGSFYNVDIDLRAGYRYGLSPEARMSIVGFRCAR